MIPMTPPTDNPRPWLGRYYGLMRCHTCDELAIGYTNWPRGGNLTNYCFAHAPQVLKDVAPNTLKVYDAVRWEHDRGVHIVVARFPERVVEWPEFDAWAVNWERGPTSRYSQECGCTRRWEQWEEELYWEWKVLRYILAKYGDDWEPQVNGEEDYLCEVCLQVLENKDYLYEMEYRGECWGRAAYEECAYGWVCPRCGSRGEV